MADTLAALTQVIVNSFLGRCIGNQNRIILILAKLILSLYRQDTDNLEGQVPHPQHLADWITAREEVVDYGLAEYCHACSSANVRVGKEFTRSNRPGLNFRVPLVYTGNTR